VVSSAIQPIVSATLPEICTGEENELTVGGGTYVDFVWTPTGSGNPLLITEGGDYSVTTTDANGCTGVANITVGVKPTPTITVLADLTVISSGQTVQLSASGAETYSWTPIESLDNPTSANPIATPLSTTTYTVLASAAGQCDVEETILITVDGEIKIPNVFTPNGDGSNDFWRIPGSETMDQCLVSIFDRNGSRVLEEFANTVNWDGNYNGKPAPQGTYYYIINCPDSKPITGNILVAR
jgi:gliding motility-associated-like protein